jgi:PST family polysaccharide transporter
MVRFALNVYGRFTLNYLVRNVDNLLVGWRFNAQSLGFYKKAYDLFSFSAFVQNLTTVGVSALSRLQNERQRYERHLLNAMSLAAFVGMGFGAVLTLVGPDVIRVLLGPRWEPAGRIFVFFGPGVGAMFLYGIHGWIHLSIGRPDRWFRWGIIELVVTCAAFIIGLWWGPAGVALASSVAMWCLLIPALWYAAQPIDIGVSKMIAAIWRYVVASVIAGIATAIISGSAVPSASVLVATAHVAQAMTLFTIVYVVSVIALHRSLAPLQQISDLLRLAMPGGRRATADAIAVGDAI